MNTVDIISLIKILIWPITVISIVAFFRKPLHRVLMNIKEFEGVGVSMKMDTTRGAEILEQGRRDNLSDDVIIAKIFNEAVFDQREFRILRALLGEANGRHLYSYQKSGYYRSALDALINKGWITHSANGYKLEPTGKTILVQKLRPLLETDEQ